MDKQQNIEARPGDAERPQESGGASPGRGGRMSRQRKTAAVLRLLRRGEWWLAGDAKPWHADAVTVASDRFGVQAAVDASRLGSVGHGRHGAGLARPPGSVTAAALYAPS